MASESLLNDPESLSEYVSGYLLLWLKLEANIDISFIYYCIYLEESLQFCDPAIQVSGNNGHKKHNNFLFVITFVFYMF